MESENPGEKSAFQNNAVFFIEVDKVHPNPYQPRKEFDEARLNDLASSIRMYGVLQPLVVTRKEVIREDGGITAEYELIAGERRLRASRIAGLREVPALIRTHADDERTKLELAIIENLQREDLNPIDRARAFQQLADQFGFKHTEIAKKVGKSREYVTNSIRILALPEEIQSALADKKISEGHARTLLMLTDRAEEQNVLFREILIKKLTVRDAEKISRKIAFDKVRKKERMFDPDIVLMEEKASQKLGARVYIEPKDVGGRIRIDYMDEEELRQIMIALNEGRNLANKDAVVVEGENNSVDTVPGENNSSVSDVGALESTVSESLALESENSEEALENATPLSFIEEQDAEWESENQFEDDDTFGLDKFSI